MTTKTDSRPCVWTFDPDDYSWDTDCKNTFIIEDGIVKLDATFTDNYGDSYDYAPEDDTMQTRGGGIYHEDDERACMSCPMVGMCKRAR